MSKYGLNKVVRKDSESGVLGVSHCCMYHRNGKKAPGYRAYFGKMTKKFSCNKYGARTFELAYDWRRRMQTEFNAGLIDTTGATISRGDQVWQCLSEEVG